MEVAGFKSYNEGLSKDHLESKMILVILCICCLVKADNKYK